MGKVYVFASILLAQLSGMLTSTSLVWSSPMLVKLNGTDDNPLGRRITSTENSFLASLATLGACFGTILCGIFAKKFGRKTFLITAAFQQLIFNLVMAFATNIWFFYVSRFITGVSVGITFPILPMYSGEIPDVENRGILGASTQVFITLGVLVPFCLGAISTFFEYHIILAIFATIIIPITYFCLPESPHFLIDRDYSKARKILGKIRRRSEIDANIEAIRQSSRNIPQGSISDIFGDRGVRRAMIIGFNLISFNVLSGNTIVFGYCQTIFEEAGSAIQADICPIILAAAQLVISVIIAPINDKFPRKFLLILSYSGVVLSGIPLGAYFFLKDHGNDMKSYSYVPLVCLFLSTISFNAGIGPVGFTMLGEVFPLSVKGKAISIIVLYNWIFAFLVTFLFNPLKNSMGMGLIFLLFPGFSFLAIFYIIFFVVETKGKTFEEIRKKLSE